MQKIKFCIKFCLNFVQISLLNLLKLGPILTNWGGSSKAYH